MELGQVTGYCVVMGVLITWTGSRRAGWPCVFVVVCGGVTTPLMLAGLCQMLAIPYSDEQALAAMALALVAYCGYVLFVWRYYDEPVTVRRFNAAVRRSMSGVTRRRAALRDVRRAAKGQATVTYRIEVEG